MLDGSGVGRGVGVAKLALKETNPLPQGVCVRLMVKSAGKVPDCVLTVPAVQLPFTSKLTSPGVFEVSMIEVLVKVPNMELPKVRLLGLDGMKETDQVCWGMPANTPLWSLVVAMDQNVKLVAVLMFPELVVVLPTLTKTCIPVGLACALVARTRQIASVDSTETITGRIANLP
jgi:hypothetical protein